jgi:hypothetical protein
MYPYCSYMYSYRCLYILIFVHLILDAATLTAGFPCFFLGCKANARIKLAKTGHGPHSSSSCVVLCIYCFFNRSMYCLCVNVCYCHWVTTQLQLINISYHINLNIGRGKVSYFGLYTPKKEDLKKKKSFIINYRKYYTYQQQWLNLTLMRHERYNIKYWYP